jgi:hypothetical protein
MNYFHKMISLDKNQRLFYSYYPSLRTMQDTPNLNTINWPKVDLLGVKYIIAPQWYTNYQRVFIQHGFGLVFNADQVVVYQNPNVLPRAFTISMDRIVYGAAVNLPSDVHLGLKSVKITLYRNTEVRLEGEVDQPSLVILTDNWHENWKASVNGVVAPIIPVSGTFRGVRVPPGKFEVYMHYQPRTLKMAVIFTVSMIFLLIFLFIFHKRADDLISRWLPGFLL